jgi:hypothetical protein
MKLSQNFEIVLLIIFSSISSFAQISIGVHHRGAPHLFEIYHDRKLSNLRAAMTFYAFQDDSLRIKYVECSYVLISINDTSKTMVANAHYCYTIDESIKNVSITDSVISFEMNDDIFCPKCVTQFVLKKKKTKDWFIYEIHGTGTFINGLNDESVTTEWKQVESINLPYHTLVPYSLD